MTEPDRVERTFHGQWFQHVRFDGDHLQRREPTRDASEDVGVRIQQGHLRLTR